MNRFVLFSLLLFVAGQLRAQLRPDGATASFRGSLPPKPTAALSAEQEAQLEKELAAVTEAFQAVKKHARAADAHIFLKAVRYALDFDEWYDKKREDGMKKATALIDEAKKRIESLEKNQTPWLEGPGQKVLGFYSRIDDSPQPYGVEIPEGLEWGKGRKPVAMWIWLHGRGDTATDLHFVYSRLMAKKPGQFQPAGTIVIHPFGRYCNGWKSAGETDVFEAREDASKRFNVDDNRIVLAGFSMGGAGAWHLGAHFADQWACVHPGAGFVDVKRYQKLTPDKMPVWYEQTLWGVYDVPNYARNFFNVPLVVYSGEQDAQRDSAEYMGEILAKEGLTMKHFIGPGMGHKYHPEVIKEVQAEIEKAVAKGRDPMPKKAVLQTRSARYAKMGWIQISEVEKQWDDTLVDAELVGDSELRIATKNVAALKVDSNVANLAKRKVTIDGEVVGSGASTFAKAAGKWSVAKGQGTRLAKAGGTSMEDGFLGPFVIVLPDQSSGDPGFDAWVKAESEHSILRWRSLMRGDPKVMTPAEVAAQEPSDSLILWGNAKSNSLIGKLFSEDQAKLVAAPVPFSWSPGAIRVGDQKFDAEGKVLCAHYPRPGNAKGGPRFVILNSGLTFREAHDRTNSLQNPKLPDWAVIDFTTPPNAEAPGKIAAADFFDEHWQVKKEK